MSGELRDFFKNFSLFCLSIHFVIVCHLNKQVIFTQGIFLKTGLISISQG